MGQVFGGVRKGLVEAVKHGNWEEVKNYAHGGLREKELKELATVYSSDRHRFPREEFKVILKLCKTSLIESVCKELVEQKLWRSVGACLERGVNENFRKLAVEVALDDAQDDDLPDILAHCTDAQFDDVFSAAVDRGIWGAVGALLKRERTVWTWRGFRSESWASDEQRKEAFQGAIQSENITDQDLARILCSIAADQNMRDKCLRSAVIKGLWITVRDILMLKLESWRAANKSILRQITGALGCSPRVQMSWLSALDRWALAQAVHRADEQVLMKHFLPFCGGDMVETVLKDLVSRKLWRAACKLLLQNKDEEDSSADQPVRQNVNESDHADSQNNSISLLPDTSGPPSNVFRKDDDRFAFILKQSVRREMWGVVREMQKHDFTDDQLQWVTGESTKAAGMMGCSLDNSRHGSKDQLQSLLAMLDTTVHV